MISIFFVIDLRPKQKLRPPVKLLSTKYYLTVKYTCYCLYMLPNYDPTKSIAN